MRPGQSNQPSAVSRSWFTVLSLLVPFEEFLDDFVLVGRQNSPRGVGLQRLTLVLPSRHFVSFAQAIIFRGAGFEAVWREFAAVAGIGLAFFFYSISRFRDSIAVSK
jgi:hypothetical protein